MYVGSCGAAMLLYKLAKVQCSLQGDSSGGGGGGGDTRPPPLFGRSKDMLLRAALGHCKSGLAAMTEAETSPRVTFLEGEAGCHALSAAIFAAMNKMDAAAASVERLVAMQPRVAAMPPSECELLYGRCGYLHALLFARKHVGGYVAKALLPPSLFQGIIAQVIDEGARGAAATMRETKTAAAAAATTATTTTAAASKMGAKDADDGGGERDGGGSGGGAKDSCGTAAGTARTWGLMHEWHGKRYLGCCHGSAGVALTLLQCEAELGWGDGECWGGIRGEHATSEQSRENEEGEEERDAVPATSRVRDFIAGLTASLFEDGNLPSSITSTAGNKLVQWCHGAPGLLPLLAAAVGHPGPSVVRGLPRFFSFARRPVVR